MPDQPAPGTTPGKIPGASSGPSPGSPSQTSPATGNTLPGQDMDLQDPALVIDLFQQAAQLNLDTPRRTGCHVQLPRQGTLTMTGDLHDNLANLQRIIKLANLAKSEDRYLILHELIHGESLINGMDLSIRTLARIAALKCQYPAQVLLMFGNHDLAQMHGEDILKAGASVVAAFDRGVDYIYGEQADDVRHAMNTFIRSFLLAVRCDNGIFCAHSLPSPRKIDQFDPTILDRVPTDDDLASHGSVSLMIWGRHHNDKIADELAEKLNAELFILGHQPAEMGYELEGERIIILSSDHNHGVAIPIDLSRTYDQESIVEIIRPLNSVKLEP